MAAFKNQRAAMSFADQHWRPLIDATHGIPCATFLTKIEEPTKS